MVSPVRVWLNRTYAENVFFMDQLRRNPQGRPVEIHATHGDPDSPVLAAADTAAPEPENLSPAGYVEYALDQCARRGFDVFVPVLHQAVLAAHRDDFAALGTTLLAPPAEATALFANKAVAYETVERVGAPVPPWWRVRDEEQLLAAVDAIEAAGGKACFKPTTGEGGVGFRVITRAPFSMLHLTGFPSPYVPLELVTGALRRTERSVDWLVMPRLDEPEVSVDCLTGPDGEVRMAVGRTKNGRRRGFTVDPAWIGPARLVARSFGLHWLTNIQFRMYAGEPVLMDVNTRPSGGLHQLAQCGLNVPWAAVRLALGDDPGELTPDFLGSDYAVVPGPRTLCPAVPKQRTAPPDEAAAAAVVPESRGAAASALPVGAPPRPAELP
ncbi:ATP-grasp domain-containing protein [uncultured Streptomyces sp.]|uniref:ATP-grasp domain-containing protein n=1 Tax=uncultured Streptomyces sp. TaxID=174707 RepID=UPI00262F683C|nr:ATP-grasp domain-containing protein [uncultured Streptomyces sp.]